MMKKLKTNFKDNLKYLCEANGLKVKKTKTTTRNQRNYQITRFIYQDL